jgi:hypothetical protein
VVKPILQKYAEGTPRYSLWKEYQALAASLLPTPVGKKRNGGLADPQSVSHILTNKWWLGLKHRTTKKTARFNKETQKYKVTRTKLDSSATEFHEVETNLASQPLIDVATWNKIQARIAEGSEAAGRKQKHDMEVLAHPLFFCPKCGAKMTPVFPSKTDRKNKRQPMYVCLTRRHKGLAGCNQATVNARRFDKVVAQTFVTWLFNNDFVDGEFERQASASHEAEKRSEVERRQFTVTDLEKRCKRLLDDLETSDDPEVRQRLNTRRGELASANSALDTATDKMKAKPRLDKTAAKLEIWQDLADFAAKSMAEKKALLAQYATRITLRIGKPRRLSKNF